MSFAVIFNLSLPYFFGFLRLRDIGSSMRIFHNPILNGTIGFGLFAVLIGDMGIGFSLGSSASCVAFFLSASAVPLSASAVS